MSIQLLKLIHRTFGTYAAARYIRDCGYDIELALILLTPIKLKEVK